ncbi:hypothetical protein [Mycetocola sp. JXN-3]|uniref:hypothetical protein n=1 Tax=Mycetocola sp. JXN-3 TaxID=2116510 RepID=UPI00165D265B|nr:hypothetical protein [Mycetocola sp. JXN-3]
MSLRSVLTGGVLAAALIVALPGAAFASPEDRSIELTGSGQGELGDMFGSQILIPGSKISADFNVVRRGGGVSTLSLALFADMDPRGPLGLSARVSVRTPTAQENAVLGDLLREGSVMDLGTGADQVTPVHLEIALPGESGNGTMDRTVPFKIRVTAQDRTALPDANANGARPASAGHGGGWLSETGASPAPWLWTAGGVIAAGALVLIGRRRRETSPK